MHYQFCTITKNQTVNNCLTGWSADVLSEHYDPYITKIEMGKGSATLTWMEKKTAIRDDDKASGWVTDELDGCFLFLHSSKQNSIRISEEITLKWKRNQQYRYSVMQEAAKKSKGLALEQNDRGYSVVCWWLKNGEKEMQ